MKRLVFWITAIVISTTLSACDLPRSAPTMQEILTGKDQETYPFSIINADIEGFSPPNVEVYHSVEKEWKSFDSQIYHGNVQVGDEIIVSLWDPNSSSLLVAPGQRKTDFSPVLIDETATVYLPYLGTVNLNNLSVSEVREEIAERYQRVVPSGQVDVKINYGPLNSAQIISGVQNPGFYPIGRSLRISELLSLSGGPLLGLTNPTVHIRRENQTASVPLDFLITDSSYDIHLKGQDLLKIESDRRSYTVLGYAGRQEQIPFNKDQINLLEALANVGGVSDKQADITGIAVLRTQNQGNEVLYVHDISHAIGLKNARNFYMNNDDVLVVTESKYSAITKVLSLYFTGSRI